MTKRIWTKHKLTEAQLKRLAQLNARLPHLHGNSLSALERKGLIEKRPVRCPDCGNTEIIFINRHYSPHSDHPLDLLRCSNGHTNKREEWGGTYQHEYQLTKAGFEAFRDARMEGW